MGGPIEESDKDACGEHACGGYPQEQDLQPCISDRCMGRVACEKERKKEEKIRKEKGAVKKEEEEEAQDGGLWCTT